MGKEMLFMRKLLLGILFSFLLLQLPAFAASITLTSPNGGETWAKGSTVTISWTSTNVSYVYLDLTNSAGGYGYGDSITNLVNVEGNPGSASWTIPTNVNAGTYKLKIGTCSTKANRNDCGGASVADVYDYSDGTITLVAATTTTAGCSVDSDCAITGTTWAGATFCDSTGLKVMQYKVAPTCQSGTCIFTTSVQAVKEDCTPSSKICDFTTAGGGVYACIAGTPPSTCATNSPITTRCICGSGVYGGAYYTWSGYDPGYCCGSGSNAYQTSPGPCPTTTTTAAAQGVCAVSSSSGNFPSKSDPDRGANYMKFLIPLGVSSIDDAKGKCSEFIFAQLTNDLCNANRITEKILQRQVALYDNNGTAYSLTCASTGCDYFACPPAGTNITTAQPTTTIFSTTTSQANATTPTAAATTMQPATTLTTSTQQQNCFDYCAKQPHILCTGSWKISGSYPNCDCKFECESPTIATKPEKEKTEKQKLSCSDSDNGLSIYNRGFATNKDGQISEDKCAENNLIEFYCKDGEVSEYTTNCANGCNDGACVSPLAKLIQDLIALLKSIFGLK